MKNIAAAIALVASAAIVGCAQLDSGKLATTGASAASAGKGGNKAGTAVAASAVGVGAASAIVASRTETKPSDGNASASHQGVSDQSAATRKTRDAQSRPVERTARQGNPQPAPAPAPVNKPQYTVAQYRAAFAKKTPEQIVAYLDAILKMNIEKRKQQGFDHGTACEAVPASVGFEVAAAAGGLTCARVIESAYNQLKTLNDQGELKIVIGKLPILEKCLHVKSSEEKEYSRFPDTIADYMLSIDLVIGCDALRTLVSKLSEAKKSELYDAAMKRATARKDRLVMEGYYLNMPVLDLAILNWHNGFDKKTKIGFPLWYSWDDSSVGTLSKQTVTSITFSNKAWIKFMECEDKDALRQLIHQYVDKKPGKAGNLDYLSNIKIEGVDIPNNGHKVGHVYSNSRLETKVAYITKEGYIVFLEF